MRLGNISFIILFFTNTLFAFSDDKIQSVPLINLEQLSPTFEEEKSELEKFDEIKYDYEKNEKIVNSAESTKDDKIYVNLTALDKITAKTSSIRLAVGEIKSFGSLEIKALKCAYSKDDDNPDTLAYIQVKDLSNKENDQVFVFNGWTFASSPTLRSLDHAIYDLWLLGCSNT